MAKVVPFRNVAARRKPVDAAGASGVEQAAPPGDGELVLRARAGDPTALDQLVRRHLLTVRKLAFRLLPRDRDLDDLVQECFAEALKNLDSLQDPDSFGYWLRGVLTNVVRNCLRRRKRLRLLGLWVRRDDLDDSKVNFISNAAPPDIAAELRAIYRAIERLDANSRLTLVLHRIEQLTLREVAEVLDTSYPTAKRWLSRADHELAIELGRRRGGQQT
jgi:RNA polymerase sigma factor (sigma-70 family)